MEQSILSLSEEEREALAAGLLAELRGALRFPSAALSFNNYYSAAQAGTAGALAPDAALVSALYGPLPLAEGALSEAEAAASSPAEADFLRGGERRLRRDFGGFSPAEGGHGADGNPPASAERGELEAERLSELLSRDMRRYDTGFTRY